jgi:hypothetical protein
MSPRAGEVTGLNADEFDFSTDSEEGVKSNNVPVDAIKVDSEDAKEKVQEINVMQEK